MYEKIASRSSVRLVKIANQSRRPSSSGIDILEHHCALWRAIALPQFNTVESDSRAKYKYRQLDGVDHPTLLLSIGVNVLTSVRSTVGSRRSSSDSSSKLRNWPAVFLDGLLMFLVMAFIPVVIVSTDFRQCCTIKSIAVRAKHVVLGMVLMASGELQLQFNVATVLPFP